MSIILDSVEYGDGEEKNVTRILSEENKKKKDDENVFFLSLP